MLAASPAAAAAVAPRRINERRLSCASPITLISSADVATAFLESIMPSIPFWLRKLAILSPRCIAPRAASRAFQRLRRSDRGPPKRSSGRPFGYRAPRAPAGRDDVHSSSVGPGVHIVRRDRERWAGVVPDDPESLVKLARLVHPALHVVLSSDRNFRCYCI